MAKIALLVFLSLVMAGCASVTHLSTNRNATIYVDSTNRAIGTGSARYEDHKAVWGKTKLRIEAEGCETRYFTIYRSERIRFTRVVGGFFLIYPWFWAGDYDSGYGIPLKCGEGFEE